MVHLVDTSLWIDVYRDRTGRRAADLKSICGDRPKFAWPIAMEILQGCSTEREWQTTLGHLRTQEFLAFPQRTWIEASRIFFDLQRGSITLRSSMDACLADLALENDRVLLHDDADVEAIALVRPVRQQRVNLKKIV
jgi:hypothetical protein